MKMIYLLQMPNTGSIYHIDLDEDRSGLQLQGPLKDKIVEDFSELNDVIFAKEFGYSQSADS